MRKAGVLRFVNAGLGVVFLVQAVTGLAHGPIQELSHEVWENIHATSGLLLVILAGTHIYLNWTWLKSNLFGMRSRKRS